MTPRIKEPDASEELVLLSEQLFTQVKSVNLIHDLTYQGPITTLTHPALLKAKILSNLGKLSLSPADFVHGWWYQHYTNAQNALNYHPGLDIKRGLPFEVGRALASGLDVLLDFDELGIAYLTRQTLSPAQHSLSLQSHLMSLWLNYALSPELWGTEGKWPRFHQRLHTLFEKYGLLVSLDYPGLYMLKQSASFLSNYGFKGQGSAHDYQLVLPWDFPLSAVNKLEQILAQEPTCSF